MTGKNFFKNMFSTYLWGNIYAILLTVVILGIGVKHAIAYYTHHGESIIVPNVVGLNVDKAEEIINQAGLNMVVQDTNYVKTKPADCVLEQTPNDGKRIKSTQNVYVTINAAEPPALPMPDLADNSSYREARAQLLSMGFKYIDVQYIPGEKDWVYAILVNGKKVAAGDRVSTEAKIIIQVGDGNKLSGDTSQYISPEYEYEEVEEDVPDQNEYEIIEVPESEVRPDDEVLETFEEPITNNEATKPSEPAKIESE